MQSVMSRRLETEEKPNVTVAIQDPKMSLEDEMPSAGNELEENIIELGGGTARESDIQFELEYDEPAGTNNGTFSQIDYGSAL